MHRPALTVIPDPDVIEIRGVRQNNLKGFDLDLPLGKFIVVSGPSGSGKSSLAFDTIYAEGQRRYVETFSPYTRQFLERMDKPKVDSIRGIPPAIAIEQTNGVKTTRSTVGTMTEINDYLKLLMPRVVTAICPQCERAIRPETPKSIQNEIFSLLADDTVLITFGIPAPEGTAPADFLGFIQQQGYLRVLIGGVVHRVDEPVPFDRLPPVVHVIQDRLAVTSANRTRFFEAIETALRFGKGKITIAEKSGSGPLHPFSTDWHCAHCDIEIAPPTAGLFSFNSALGACPSCRGFGRTVGIDIERAIPDRSISIADGAIRPFQTENGQECQRDLVKAAKKRDLDLDCPFDDLPDADREWVLQGESPLESGEELWKSGLWYGVKGFFKWLESKAYKMHVRVLLSRYRSYNTCPDCHGGRYQPATLNFRFAGRTLPELQHLAIDGLLTHFEDLLKKKSAALLDATSLMLLREVTSRLRYLVEAGLSYLSLDRPTRTLSGGETERVNLTTCLGASLVNTLFVLDEPSVGLHPRDTGRLVRIMRQLRDKGNTLLVVEHEEAVLRAADHLVELGPGRGENGGDLVFNGPLSDLLSGLPLGTGKKKTLPVSLTADYLLGRKSIPVPANRRKPSGFITVRGATEHNLKNIDVEVPLGIFACVTGVSGSGKSTLVHQVLYRNLATGEAASSTEEAPGACAGIDGAEAAGQVIMVDQSPLSRTPRSSPALYLGIFDAIRECYAMTVSARAHGLTAAAFSFNSGQGRCQRCSGTGYEKIEMQFLSDVFVRCPECEGKRYEPLVLGVHLDGKSIHDTLEMTVSEAISFFAHLPSTVVELGDRRDATESWEARKRHIVGPLHILDEIGLGYLKLGQPLNVLSGGESQRLKLAERLAQRGSGRALLILDEPTTGLHFDDIAMLIKAFDRLVEQGNSLIVIEHNLEVIKCADFVIDLGPDAGATGGNIVAAGTPEQVAKVKASHTGRYLRTVLGLPPQKGTAKYEIDAASEESLRVAEEMAAAASGHVPGAVMIRGAREHNLKDLTLSIPRDRIVVITGLSGSGKSTLAFDILFAEGQRRFLDSMSAYARQFVEQLEKPDVDSISGLPPTVAIEQRVTRGGGKSTVATVTEVYHFLRLLFAKLGTQYCPECQLPVQKQNIASSIRKASELAKKGRIRVLAPLVKARKGFHTEVARWAVRNGFEQLLVDDKWVAAAKFPQLERFQEHTIDVLVGERRSANHVQGLITRALDIGRGTAYILDAKNATHIVSTEMSCPRCGDSFEELDPRVFSFNSPHGWCEECHGFGEIWRTWVNPRLDSQIEIEMDEERQHEHLEDGEARPCPACHGARLNEIARNVQIQGQTINSLVALPAQAAQDWAAKLKFTGTDGQIAEGIVPEIEQRLRFMGQVGLDYLSLARSAKTLSGGESQRIRLSAQLGSNLRGVLYVLDEPTIGLHARDNARLLDTLEALREKGNSLVIVEHDEETMRRADHVIDLGPGAGTFGGEVVAQGTLDEIAKVEGSATGKYLRQPLCHPIHGSRRPLEEVTRWLEVRGAHLHNLKEIDAKFPIGRLSVISGISGSGKSTLMRGVLKPGAEAALSKKRGGKKKAEKTGLSALRADLALDAKIPLPIHGKLSSKWKRIAPVEVLDAVYEVDQSPIGKTSRSTPATYIKVFDEIRALYAHMPLARIRGYTASRFSFNTDGGRCETCTGQGVIKVEMNFLPTNWLPCPDCHGKRYNPATLEVLFNEKSIGDVMEMPLDEATQFFASIPKIHRPLSLLCETGLGYLRLGQASPTLSGGEAQRLKLVTELNRGSGRSVTAKMRGIKETKSMLYLLEEPTIGLHMSDVQKLVEVLHRLVDDGATVIVIEHNLALIAEADYVIDIGPEAGDAGGEIVACGTPEEVAQNPISRTAPYLKEVLAQGRG